MRRALRRKGGVPQREKKWTRRGTRTSLLTGTVREMMIVVAGWEDEGKKGVGG